MRSRTLPLAALAVVGLVGWGWGWGWMAQMGRGMASMRAAMPGMHMGLGVLGLMRAVMTAAMMVPAAAPSYLLHAKISKRQLGSAAYLVGYLGAWAAAGVIYALAQRGLQRAGLISSGMRLSSAPLAGAVGMGLRYAAWCVG